MDNRCYLRNCTQLTELKPAFKNECQVPDTVQEDIDGCEYIFPGPMGYANVRVRDGTASGWWNWGALSRRRYEEEGARYPISG